MALGGVLIAPLADRLGRRPLILIALVLMSGGMLASGFVEKVSELIAARIAVGVGIGTVLAAMAALAAEGCAARQQNLAVGPRAGRLSSRRRAHGARGCASPAERGLATFAALRGARDSGDATSSRR
jgi:MFS family permease